MVHGQTRKTTCDCALGRRFEQLAELGFQDHLAGGDHRDDVPRTDLSAKLAPDTDGKIDRADAHGVARLGGVRDLVDTIDGADGNARIAPRAQIFVQDRQLFG